MAWIFSTSPLAEVAVGLPYDEDIALVDMVEIPAAPEVVTEPLSEDVVEGTTADADSGTLEDVIDDDDAVAPSNRCQGSQCSKTPSLVRINTPLERLLLSLPSSSFKNSLASTLAYPLFTKKYHFTTANMFFPSIMPGFMVLLLSFGQVLAVTMGDLNRLDAAIDSMNIGVGLLGRNWRCGYLTMMSALEMGKNIEMGKAACLAGDRVRTGYVPSHDPGSQCSSSSKEPSLRRLTTLSVLSRRWFVAYPMSVLLRKRADV